MIAKEVESRIGYKILIDYYMGSRVPLLLVRVKLDVSSRDVGWLISRRLVSIRTRILVFSHRASCSAQNGLFPASE